MLEKRRDDVTSLIEKARAGEPMARDALGQAIYEELRGIAVGYMKRERRDHTLRPSELVNEAIVRLLDGSAFQKATNRRYLFGAAAQAMRRILVDHARKRKAKQRSGNRKRVPLDDVLIGIQEQRLEILSLHEALNRLSELNERQGQVVTLRYFAGLTINEVAEVLSVAPSTVEGDWRAARAHLFHQLRETTA
jgi:RNA polymerase sigma factor (TIGR02999 family)